MDYYQDMHESRCIYVIEQQMQNFAPWYTFCERVSDQDIYFRFLLRYAAWKDVPFETVCEFLGIKDQEKDHWQWYYMAVQDCSEDFFRMVENGRREEISCSQKDTGKK